MNPSSPLRYSVPDLEDEDDYDSSMYEEPVLEGDFTLRAVVVGLGVGCILCFTNIYFGLQTGWVSMMSLQSALLGFAIFKLRAVVPRLFPGRPLSVQENVVLQTTAVATGTMPLAAGLVGIIPALEMMNMKQDGREPIVLSYAHLVMWCLAVAFFGVFLAVPLRRQVIVKEKLVFPSGTATAQLIALLHHAPPPTQGLNPQPGGAYRRIPAAGDEVTQVHDAGAKDDHDPISGKGWAALGWSFLASGTMTILSFLFPVVFALPIFDVLSIPFATSLAANWQWFFTPSLSYIGQGIIMGLPVTVSMSVGMVVGWAVLSPLSKHSGWAPGPVSSTTDGARGWILWVALAIMIAESVVSLMPITVSYIKNLKQRIQARQQREEATEFTHESPYDAAERDAYYDVPPEDIDDEPEHEPPERLVPDSWVGSGLAISGVLGVFLVWIVFGSDGIHPWATAIGLVLASVLSLIGVRALGETDINPVSGIGKISQLLFAVLQPGNVVANVIAGGVAEAGAQQAGDLMQDLKTGHLLRASPRSQFYGQMIGSLASVFVSTAAYKFYTSVYEIPGPEFAVPSAGIWLNLARLLNKGSLPSHVVPFMVVFGAVFGLISALKVFSSRAIARHRVLRKVIPYLPSGVAFAIGFLNAPSFSLARLIGGYIAYRATKASRTGEIPLFAIVVASGFVLGEGVFSIVTLTLKSNGYDAVSCFGCGLGGGGYCNGRCG